jgi:hypothetical protein
MNDDLIARTQNEVLQEQKSRDGIPQIALGLFLILTSLLIYLRQESMAGILIIFVPLLTRELRRRFTYPRIGYAKLPDSSTKRHLMSLVVLGFLILGLLLYFLTTRTPMSPQTAKILYFSTMLVIALIIDLLLVFRYLKEKDVTYLLYAAALSLTVVLVWYYHLRIRTVMYIIGGFGLLNLLYGLYALRLFIRNYPVLEEDTK